LLFLRWKGGRKYSTVSSKMGFTAFVFTLKKGDMKNVKHGEVEGSFTP
jgi:hypothetical protein